MFIYTKDEQTIKRLNAENYKLLKVRDDGVYVYVLSPDSNFTFNSQSNTWLSKSLTL